MASFISYITSSSNHYNGKYFDSAGVYIWKTTSQINKLLLITCILNSQLLQYVRLAVYSGNPYSCL